jgi:membrane protease YdiL (CAAX protease family)
MAFFADRDIFFFGKIKVRHIFIGVVSAIVLYGIFYVGNIISGYLFTFKDAQISSVYSNKSNANLTIIGLFLFFIIGPGEELYWRGFIQNTLSRRLGENKGYLFSVLLYTAVHIVTGNFMLIIAALVCGLFWGWLYKKEKSLIPVIISHSIWDLTIFVMLPLM